jgi:uncharacterized membrane protein YgcG
MANESKFRKNVMEGFKDLLDNFGSRGSGGGQGRQMANDVKDLFQKFKKQEKEYIANDPTRFVKGEKNKKDHKKIKDAVEAALNNPAGLLAKQNQMTQSQLAIINVTVNRVRDDTFYMRRKMDKDFKKFEKLLKNGTALGGSGNGNPFSVGNIAAALGGTAGGAAATGAIIKGATKSGVFGKAVGSAAARSTTLAKFLTNLGKYSKIAGRVGWVALIVSQAIDPIMAKLADAPDGVVRREIVGAIAGVLGAVVGGSVGASVGGAAGSAIFGVGSIPGAAVGTIVGLFAGYYSSEYSEKLAEYIFDAIYAGSDVGKTIDKFYAEQTARRQREYDARMKVANSRRESRTKRIKSNPLYSNPTSVMNIQPSVMVQPAKPRGTDSAWGNGGSYYRKQYVPPKNMKPVYADPTGMSIMPDVMKYGPSYTPDNSKRYPTAKEREEFFKNAAPLAEELGFDIKDKKAKPSTNFQNYMQKRYKDKKTRNKLMYPISYSAEKKDPKSGGHFYSGNENMYDKDAYGNFNPTMQGTPNRRIFNGVESAMGSYLVDQRWDQMPSMYGGRFAKGNVPGGGFSRGQGLGGGGGSGGGSGGSAPKLNSNAQAELDSLLKGQTIANSPYLAKLSDAQLAEYGISKSVISSPENRGRTATQYNLTTPSISEADISAAMAGSYRPSYPLKPEDLSPEVINTIAGEARLGDPKSVDGVIHNMLNRVGAQGNWSDLKGVARAPGQYEGYRQATPEQAAMITERIRMAASGQYPDPTKGATEFRASSYVYGEGKGKTFDKIAASQGYNDVGGNIYAKTFAAGPYGSYSEKDVIKMSNTDLQKMSPYERSDLREQAKQRAIKTKMAARGSQLSQALIAAGVNDVGGFGGSYDGESKFSVLRGNPEGVNEKLVNVIKASSSDLPGDWAARMISGKDGRSTGTANHPNGLAMDVEIYNTKTGEVLTNQGFGPSFKMYEKLARSMNIRGKEMYPDERYIWGGTWISDAAGNGDAMHYQIVDESVPGSAKTSGAYSFENGVTDPNHPAYKAQMSAEERQSYDNFVKDKIKTAKANPNPKTQTQVAGAVASMGGLNSSFWNTMAPYSRKAEGMGIPSFSTSTTMGYSQSDYKATAKQLYDNWVAGGKKGNIVINGHSAGGPAAIRVAELLEKQYGVKNGVTLNLVDPVSYYDYNNKIPGNVDTANIMVADAGSWMVAMPKGVSDRTKVNVIPTGADHVGAGSAQATQETIMNSMLASGQGPRIQPAPLGTVINPNPSVEKKPEAIIPTPTKRPDVDAAGAPVETKSGEPNGTRMPPKSSSGSGLNAIATDQEPASTTQARYNQVNRNQEPLYTYGPVGVKNHPTWAN